MCRQKYQQQQQQQQQQYPQVPGLLVVGCGPKAAAAAAEALGRCRGLGSWGLPVKLLLQDASSRHQQQRVRGGFHWFPVQEDFAQIAAVAAAVRAMGRARVLSVWVRVLPQRGEV